MFYEVALIELTALQSTGKYLRRPAIHENFSRVYLMCDVAAIAW